jgi:maltose/moltooligosaccharide transporter
LEHYQHERWFFGIQYSFGLQQTNMTPIYSYLGANPDEIPLLNLAGPMTGLIIQPIVGAMSDMTLGKWGRRRPYFLVGAIICSITLFYAIQQCALDGCRFALDIRCRQ